MSCSLVLPKLVDQETKIDGLETQKKKPSSRRFSTRSGIRSRGRRGSSKKTTHSKPVLPKIQKGDKEGTRIQNIEIQRQKLGHALENPNFVQSERSLHKPVIGHTAISHHTKFLSQAPSRSVEYPGKSPYVMENDSPHKYHMSGYQGLVPRYRFLLGASFPTLTHDAMNEFTDNLRLRSKTFLRPIDLNGAATAPTGETSDMLPRRGVIYRTDTGIIPNYKGHIPGHKFRFGLTFGEITRNARGRSFTLSAK